MSMTADLTFDAGDLTPEELVAAFEALPDALGDHLEDAAEDIGLKFGSAAAENAPSDTGDLRSDLVEPVVERVAQAVIRIRVGSNLPQAAPMEYGTDPGHFPPPDELNDWVRRVFGLSSQREIDSASYLVARSISETGLEAREYLADAFADQGNIQFALNKIAAAVQAAFAEVGLDG